MAVHWRVALDVGELKGLEQVSSRRDTDVTWFLQARTVVHGMDFGKARMGARRP